MKGRVTGVFGEKVFMRSKFMSHVKLMKNRKKEEDVASRKKASSEKWLVVQSFRFVSFIGFTIVLSVANSSGKV